MSMLYFEKPPEFDSMFVKNLLQVTNKREIREITNLIDSESVNTIDMAKIELFMNKVKDRFGNWFDSLYGLQQNFDMDLSKVMEHTQLRTKVKHDKIIKRKYTNIKTDEAKTKSMDDLY